MSSNCEKAHLGNCGPNAEGDHCLFHKHNKSEEESRRFYEKLGIDATEPSQHFEERKNWSGFVFPDFDSPSLPLFMESTFEKDIDCEKARFEIRAVFDHAEFRGHADFKDATFKKPVNFKNTEFNDGADFSFATFVEKADFRLAEFCSATFNQAEFEKEADFWRTYYKERANFNRVKFYFEGEKANFGESIFSKDVDFSTGVEFWGGATFDRTEFGGDADFNYTYFKGNSSFVEADFKSIAEFSHSTFEMDAIFAAAEFNDEAYFREVHFSIKKENKKPNKFNSSNFDRSIFKYAPDFSGARFGGTLSFRLTDFSRGVNMVKYPQDFEKERFSRYQAREEAWRVQKNVYEEEGRKEDADKMYLKEMRARRNKKLNNSSLKFKKSINDFRKYLRKCDSEEDVKNKLLIPSTFLLSLLSLVVSYILVVLEKTFVDLTSEYGTNWIRILKSSGLTIFVFSIFYKLNSLGEIVSNGETVSGFLNYLYFSIVTFTTLGYGNMQPTKYLKGISAVESLIGAFLMALLVVVFARKWMR